MQHAVMRFTHPYDSLLKPLMLNFYFQYHYFFPPKTLKIQFMQFVQAIGLTANCCQFESLYFQHGT